MVETNNFINKICISNTDDLDIIFKKIANGGNHNADLICVYDNNQINFSKIEFLSSIYWYDYNILEVDHVVGYLNNFCKGKDYVEVRLFDTSKDYRSVMETYKLNFERNDFVIIDFLNNDDINIKNKMNNHSIMSIKQKKFRFEQINAILSYIVKGGKHRADMTCVYNNDGNNKELIKEYYWGDSDDEYNPNPDDIVNDILKICYKKQNIVICLFRADQGRYPTEVINLSMKTNEYELIDIFDKEENIRETINVWLNFFLKYENKL